MASKQRARGKNERRPVIDTGSVVARGSSGSVIMRGPAGGTIRRGGRSGIRFLVFVGILLALYLVVGSYRAEIVARIPAAYPILKALGYEIEEPAGFGLRAEVLAWDRQRDEHNAAYLLINGRIQNTGGNRVTVPRLRLVISSSRHPDIVVLAAPPATVLAPREQARFEVRHRTGVMLLDVKVRVGFERK